MKVDFFGYPGSPAPANYLAASGFTSLFSIKEGLRYDSRINPFMATKGQYVQLRAEQGTEASAGKFDAEGRTYFKTGGHFDGTGKRPLYLPWYFGIATRSTPVTSDTLPATTAACALPVPAVSPHVFNVPPAAS